MTDIKATPATDAQIAVWSAFSLAHMKCDDDPVLEHNKVLSLIARIAADREMWQETAGCADGHEPIRWEPGKGSKTCPHCTLRAQVETLREALRTGCNRASFHACKYPTDGCWVCDARAVLAETDQVQKLRDALEDCIDDLERGNCEPNFVREHRAALAATEPM